MRTGSRTWSGTTGGSSASSSTGRRSVRYAAAGMRQSILDAILNMSGEHLSPDAPTVFERLEDAGLTAAAVNITCYRGRTPHRTTIPGVTRSALGPKRFFFYNLFESDETGAPAGVAQTARRARSTITRPRSAAGWSRATASTSSSSTSRTTTTSPMHTGPTRRGKESPASTVRSGRSSRRRAARTSSSSATPCCSAQIMGRRPSGTRARLQKPLSRRSTDRRDRLEPRRDGLPPRRLPAGRARARRATRPGALGRPRRLSRRGSESSSGERARSRGR